MKILFFIYTLSGGGAERVTATLASHWADKGWDVTIVSVSAGGHDEYEVAPGVRRIALDMAGKSSSMIAAVRANLRRARALREVLLQLRPDVAIAVESSASILLSLAARRLHVVTIGSEHSFPPFTPLTAVWNRLRRRAYGKLDAVVALTRECADWLRENTSARRIPVIPNPAGWPLVPHVPVVEPSLLCGRGRRILLAAGRLSPEKNVGMLIEAFAALAAHHPEWDLVIAGEGGERAVLERQVRAASLEQRILFAGRVGNLGDWYGRADLYAMTSRFEGFPNTLVEALAHGVPAVSIDCKTGPRDIIRHGVDGFLVPPDDMRGLQRALALLLGDADLRARLGGRATDARTRFSLEKVSALWEDLFNECLRDKHCLTRSARAGTQRIDGASHEY
ncbi:MAG TPA: glycosyltransferase family 4 protein [Noviherbaspirillum sp.]|uniref:glycosyltransferase family 4 protein n=1 Tax=Noviherbaspirillum sp. TaxID=1926288 RepID=UPI002D57D8F9|nr:glycosyltransferase family 4 protein [Noviherbaspirillum sp.]HYD93801.1 glycosyltransferase family 4 protein [Noviherbaspirillum sp.]